MTHKGGKRARKAYRKVNLPVKWKERIENMKPGQLHALLIFLQALMASSGRTVRAGKRKAGAKTRSHTHKLRAGLHRVKVGKHMRNVRVLTNGKWRFLKE